MPIRITNLIKNFSAGNVKTPVRTAVLNVPGFELADGDQVALVGKSGGGKSTLLNVIAGIVTADSGEVMINSTDITQLSEPARDTFRAANIGYVFQTFNLIQGLTAMENVILAMSFAGKVKNMEARAKELLSLVGLAEKLANKPRELSVGQQQRVAIARAVANEPQLILADEPTANLDEASSDLVITLLKKVCSESGRMLILVTHEREVAA
ncbi:MAG: ABC transporter ATP-binding protein, partial [Rhizobacter sp.]|nr:ABC transporter ATP-binding protein [Chlorobiales bacterium]